MSRASRAERRARRGFRLIHFSVCDRRSNRGQVIPAAASHLPKSLHVVVPGGHSVTGPEVQHLEQTFLDQGFARGLDLSAVEQLTLPPFALPETSKGN